MREQLCLPSRSSIHLCVRTLRYLYDSCHTDHQANQTVTTHMKMFQYQLDVNNRMLANLPCLASYSYRKHSMTRCKIASMNVVHGFYKKTNVLISKAIVQAAYANDLLLAIRKLAATKQIRMLEIVKSREDSFTNQGLRLCLRGMQGMVTPNGQMQWISDGSRSSLACLSKRALQSLRVLLSTIDSQRMQETLAQLTPSVEPL
jgi:hypothetical protein